MLLYLYIICLLNLQQIRKQICCEILGFLIRSKLGMLIYNKKSKKAKKSKIEANLKSKNEIMKKINYKKIKK